MISLDKIKFEDLIFFKGKNIIIGNGNYKKQKMIYSIYKNFGFNVLGIYVPNLTRNKLLLLKYEGIKLISDDDMMKMSYNLGEILIQSVAYSLEDWTESKIIAQNYNMEFSPYYSGQIISSFYPEYYLNKIENKIKYIWEYLKWYFSYYNKSSFDWEKFKKNNVKNSEAIIICSPKKTADISLNKTFDYLNSHSGKNEKHIKYTNLHHKIQAINRVECEQNFGEFKVLVGIREPIAQNISTLFQELSEGTDISNWIFGEIQGLHSKEVTKKIAEYKNVFIYNGDNIQMIWNSFINRYIYSKSKTSAIKSIQQFMPEMKNNLLDILKYDFDKENGYTIIKEGNTEIFVYQLEKLNKLVPKLSEWVGISFDKLEKGNIGEDKWIADNYKQALADIEITQEYFDRCYSEPYVQHCYSQEDIEKFKARWRPHIKKED